ncbi:unnamed protein product [Arabis nemorensis]|uniref:3'-5' exonuclease domain-containing protein n=1 Tax=Arabis nemorensis TaxID=586526 RepID=A0A565C5T8_9BRAS|nr:unnamed protein product [Arabis nemorensis]
MASSSPTQRTHVPIPPEPGAIYKAPLIFFDSRFLVPLFSGSYSLWIIHPPSFAANLSSFFCFSSSVVFVTNRLASLFVVYLYRSAYPSDSLKNFVVFRRQYRLFVNVNFISDRNVSLAIYFMGVCGRALTQDVNEPPVPIHIVTDPLQLPADFLNPSPDKKLVIGFDCEGVDLCRHGKLCIMQIAFSNAIYLVDVIQGGETLMKACKPALESNYITKVIHDCKRDSEALYFQFGIRLHNVVDTQIAYSLIEEQEGRRRPLDDYISFVSLLADPRYCGISYDEKEEVRVLMRQDPKFWTYRPMTELMVRAAADDVRFLLYLYHKMMGKLNQRSLWHLAVRGALYCRCLCCMKDADFADWPTVPPIPDNLRSEDQCPEEEILSVLDVPPGKMGRVIGRKGASILAIKEACNAEILIGGAKGPPDKIFVIGPVKEVRKAEAILRGRMIDY